MKKIKINKLPEGFKRMPNGQIVKDTGAQKMQAGGQPTLQPTSRAAANLEAEKGETVVTDLDKNNIPEHYKIGGKKHSEGGTPLNLPPKSFIFSDHKSMSIKGDALKKFIPGTKKKSMTPAEISSMKQFDLSEDNKILQDENADAMAKSTAERNIQSKLVKLGELAMEQESIKDFEGGIPEIALPFLKRNGVTPEQVEMINAEIEQADMMESMMAGYGKEMYGYGGSKKKKSYYQTAGQTNEVYASDVPEIFNKIGFSLDDSMIGSTKYSDVQSYVGDGLYEGAKNNIEGFKKAFTGVYSDIDKLAESLGTVGKNKSNPEVEKFQKWFNSTYIPKLVTKIAKDVKDVRGVSLSAADKDELKTGLITEFGFGSAKTGADFDGLMGTYTSSRLPINYKINALPEEEPAPTPGTPEFVPAPKGDVGYFPEDLINIAAVAGMNFPREYGYTQRLQPNLPDAVFLDPERQLQANQEVGATNAQAMALQGRSQNLAANLAYMQGKLAANQADTLSTYNNANVQIANNLELKRADAMNKFAEYNAAQNRQQRMDTATVNEAFAQQRNQQLENMSEAVNQALGNVRMQKLINELPDNYAYNPMTGEYIFTGSALPEGDALSEMDQVQANAAASQPRTKESNKARMGGQSFRTQLLKKFIK